jgi:hypothetical protein
MGEEARISGKAFFCLFSKLTGIRGSIFFVFPHQPNWNNHCHIFASRSWEGEVQESEGLQERGEGWVGGLRERVERKNLKVGKKEERDG